ncbi:methyltransferase, FkbM family [Paracoccus isoporae]|uniref:Methyltransferase, FkbM family n=1 Tax=Paracoccus isoporae TaxID=591205 RepID=A0A1G7ERD6_9RHOB|nr:FkbM family methyltransferase [Paracoccus isoporae]SDE66147.1 methyltransferase, FkbM family [Paracoccus isoporae]
MTQRLVVYTMAVGRDYPLPEIKFPTKADYICFTDRELASNPGWTLKEIEKIIPGDPIRSSKDFKVRPHRWLINHDRSIYIDSKVRLDADPNEIWELLIPTPETVFGGILHSFRDSLEGEFIEVKRKGLDQDSIIDEQLHAYKEYSAEILQNRPVWGGFLARRHKHPNCIEAMELWFAHTLRYSRRDQLSLPLALSRLAQGEKRLIQRNLQKSEFHKWPVQKKLNHPKNHGKSEMLPEQEQQATIERTAMSRKSSTGHDSEADLFFFQEPADGRRIYVSHKKRLSLYRKGFQHRQDWLLRDYQIPRNLLNDGDMVLDVGANIGELGIWANMNNARYVGFEPDPIAFRALNRNVTGKLYDIALADEAGYAEFYLSTSEADSSLIAPQKIEERISVRKERLDDLLPALDLSREIKLLKVEAEGYEAEILQGARETLKQVEYIAVDAGPERGGENTVPGVLNLLTGSGFEILSCFLKRGTFFLRRRDSMT